MIRGRVGVDYCDHTSEVDEYVVVHQRGMECPGCRLTEAEAKAEELEDEVKDLESQVEELRAQRDELAARVLELEAMRGGAS